MPLRAPPVSNSPDRRQLWLTTLCFRVGRRCSVVTSAQVCDQLMTLRLADLAGRDKVRVKPCCEIISCTCQTESTVA